MDSFLSGLLVVFKDRSFIFYILFGCISIIACSKFLNEFGFITPLRVYKMVPIFIVYFIVGIFIAQFSLKLLSWNDSRIKNENFIEYMKVQATAEEKLVLKLLVDNRTLTLQQIAELQYQKSLEQVIQDDRDSLTKIASTLQVLVDNEILIERDISPNRNGGYRMYYLSKDYFSILKNNSKLLKQADT